MRFTFILIALLLTQPLLAETDSHEVFAPLAFLAGSCYSGTFPDGKAVDEHCFSWMYEGAFLRDVHVVKAPDRPDYFGRRSTIATRNREPLPITTTTLSAA